MLGNVDRATFSNSGLMILLSGITEINDSMSPDRLLHKAFGEFHEGRFQVDFFFAEQFQGKPVADQR